MRCLLRYAGPSESTNQIMRVIIARELLTKPEGGPGRHQERMRRR